MSMPTPGTLGDTASPPSEPDLPPTEPIDIAALIRSGQ